MKSLNNLFGTANKGIGKLKGFIFGNTSSSEDSQQTQSSEENNTKENTSQNSKNTANAQPQKNTAPLKSPQKEEPKNNTIIKSSKGQFDFSEEDDDEEAKPKKNQNESDNTDLNYEYSEPEEDYWKIAHRLYLKNSMVDIEPLPYVPFIKIKKNDNLLSLMGFGNKKPFREVKYFAVFDEHFLYMINMTTKDNNQNNFFKKIGNHYDLTKVSNIEIKDDEILPGKKLIKIVFLLDNDNNNFSTINKELHFEKNDAIKFFSILKFYLKKYGVPLIFKDENKEGTEEKEEEDEEEEEEDDENENKEEENKDKNEKKDEKNEKKDDKKENVAKDKKEEVQEEKKEDTQKNKKEEVKSEEKKDEVKDYKKEEVKDDKKEEAKEEKNEEVKEDKKEEVKNEEKKEEVKEGEQK